MKIQDSASVGEVVVAYPQVRPVLERLGIDYCCGGDKPLVQAAAERGLGWEKVLADLEAAVNVAAEPDKDWSRSTLADLADHIEDRHHAFLRAQLPRIEGLFTRVIPAHRLAHGELLERLHNVFASLRQEIEEHLYKEEQVLFPYIREMEAELRSGHGVPPMHCGSVEGPIRQMMLEHENAGAALAKLANETSTTPCRRTPARLTRRCTMACGSSRTTSTSTSTWRTTSCSPEPSRPSRREPFHDQTAGNAAEGLGPGRVRDCVTEMVEKG